MAVKRIVANIGASDIGLAKGFYHDILGLDLVMDQGWIQTFAGEGQGQAASQHRFGGRLRDARAGSIDRGGRSR